VTCGFGAMGASTFTLGIDMSTYYKKYLELETLQAQISAIIGVCMHYVPDNYDSDNELINALWAAQDLSKRAESVVAELYKERSNDTSHDAWNEGFSAGLEYLLSEEDDAGEDSAADDEEEDEEADEDGADRFHSAVIILINAQEEE
jgi:hypothetical protein